MVRVEKLYDTLQAHGVDFFTGVPDSLLKDFCAYVTDHTPCGRHIIAANEGAAVGIAAGIIWPRVGCRWYICRTRVWEIR